MGYTDLGDSLEDMKTRAGHRGLHFPVPLRRRDPEATAKYRHVATPDVFVFDRARTPALPGPD